MVPDTARDPAPGLATMGAALLDRGSAAAGYVVDEVLRLSRAPLYLTSHVIEGNLLPALTFLSTMQEDIATSWHATLTGAKPLSRHVAELRQRVTSGAKYESLVHTLGAQLFGSATFPGQQTLASSGPFELNYLPAAAGVAPQPMALFHVGGFIPYGDRIFRFLPEANYYDRFLERGVPVYALELRGPKDALGELRGLTVERIIDAIGELGQTAFEHHGRRKLVIEGYCGTGMQMLAYLAARPREAEERFSAAATFVAPVDARTCLPIAALLLHLPRTLITTQVALAELLRGYLRGVELWAGLDTSLKNIFAKTSLGRFAAGWKAASWAGVNTVADLTPKQRLELAAAYWISVHNAERFPIPADLIRFFAHLFTDGVKADGAIGVSYQGRPLNLGTIARETSLRVFSFYGGQDLVAQESSGRVLGQILGDRYHHHVHAQAAHVSYIMSPVTWQPGNPRTLTPNPIDVLLAATGASDPVTIVSAPPAAPPPAPTERPTRKRPRA